MTPEDARSHQWQVGDDVIWLYEARGGYGFVQQVKAQSGRCLKISREDRSRATPYRRPTANGDTIRATSQTLSSEEGR